MPVSNSPLLIAGLGNPGADYARNRHNAGFMAVDVIHESYDFSPWRSKFHGAVSEGSFGKRKVILLKPMTYMNDSGMSVAPAARFFKIAPPDIVVIHDELDLAAGKMRMKAGGGDAGHNGLRSISAALGPTYRRLRIGVGHPGDKSRVHGHVLNNFSKADEDWLVPMLSAIAEAAPLLARNDDARFTTKISLALNPPVKNPKPGKTAKPESPEEKDTE
ncbi:MAG TPA: aminoacyl-tRNA hydrolase [Rhizomicrobium sp.]|nr:aminoacyl-tRNA hydrolase [Rhizomicrobium sp.]